MRLPFHEIRIGEVALRLIGAWEREMFPGVFGRLHGSSCISLIEPDPEVRDAQRNPLYQSGSYPSMIGFAVGL